jgi:predicted PurR-regulated permease PerM
MVQRRFSNTIQKNFLLIISFLFIFLSFYVLKDILFVIIFSLILSYFLFPIYIFFLKRLGNKKLSSIMTLLVFFVVIFIPFSLVSYYIIIKAIKLVLDYKVYIENPEVLNGFISSFFEKVTNSSVLSGINYSDFFNNLVLFILETSKNFFTSIPVFLFNLGMILFISYYILIYNKNLFKAMNEYIPLSLKRQNELILSIQKNLKVLFKGYFITGIIQTLIAFIGYYIFDAPNLLIVTVLTLFFSLIPYLGTPIIWVPISIYLILSGDLFGGFGLLIYGILIISTVDNFLRPILMSDKETISPPLVFVGFMGGLFSFGISGIILGPIIISITAIFLRYLKENYAAEE